MGAQKGKKKTMKIYDKKQGGEYQMNITYKESSRTYPTGHQNNLSMSDAYAIGPQGGQGTI